MSGAGSSNSFSARLGGAGGPGGKLKVFRLSPWVLLLLLPLVFVAFVVLGLLFVGGALFGGGLRLPRGRGAGDSAEPQIQGEGAHSHTAARDELKQAKIIDAEFRDVE